MKFPLPCLTWLMRPLPGQNADEEQRFHNYHHSRARTIIEKSIRATVENVESYALACLVLHNYLRLIENAYYCYAGFVDLESSTGQIKPGDWRNDVNEEFCNGFRDVRSIRGSRYSLGAIEIRKNLKNYLNSEEGSVPWQ